MAMLAVIDQFRGRNRQLCETIRETQNRQLTDGVGQKIQADTQGTHLCGRLVDGDIDSGAVQVKRRRQPPRPCADNQHSQAWIPHGGSMYPIPLPAQTTANHSTSERTAASFARAPLE